MPMPTIKKIQEHCLGSGTSRIHRGSVRTALAMYQKVFVSSHATQLDISPVQKQDGLVLSPATAAAIAKRVVSLETFFGVQDLSFQEEEHTNLSEDEMDRIEVELMWAWLKQVVYFDRFESKAYDLLSLKEVHLDRSEILNIQYLHRRYDTRGFFAIYFNLSLENEDYIVSSDLYTSSLLSRGGETHRTRISRVHLYYLPHIRCLPGIIRGADHFR